MFRKAFQVQVELELQSVTCPGVWLCPNGKVSLQLHLLGSCIQTSSIEPLFPLLYNEKFVFCKTFYSVQKLSSLQKVLGKEALYAELIQWQNCEVGNVLATFDTSLAEVLFPGKRAGTMTGIDVDLLMEPTKNFPGILAPKIEISTKTTIEDKVYTEADPCSSYVLNPKVFTSKSYESNIPVGHQRKVCHTSKYHKSRKCIDAAQNINNRPPFVFKRVDDYLIQRKPCEIESIYDCKCRRSPIKSYHNQSTKRSCFEEDFSKKSTQPISYVVKNDPCACNSMHDNCVICSKYKYYFESEAPSIKSKKCHQKRCCVTKGLKTTCCCTDCGETVKLCNYPPRPDLSFADRVHSNLNETLNRCLNSPYLDRCSNRFDDECDCSSFEDRCSGTHFSDFYKNLYDKTKTTCGKYITCK